MSGKVSAAELAKMMDDSEDEGEVRITAADASASANTSMNDADDFSDSEDSESEDDEYDDQMMGQIHQQEEDDDSEEEIPAVQAQGEGLPAQPASNGQNSISQPEQQSELVQEPSAEEQLMTKIANLEQQVAMYPTFYQGHLDLIDSLSQTGSEHERLRAVRERFASSFPLTSTLWKEWIEDEKEAASTPEDRAYVASLYNRSIHDYHSVSLWTEYAQYMVERSKLDTHEVDADSIRSVFEAALSTSAGLDVSSTGSLWSAYISWESSSPRPTEERTAVLRTLYLRCLSSPHLELDSAMSQYRELERSVSLPDSAKSLQEADIRYTAAKKALQTRLPFEEQISSASTPEDVTAAWNSYIEFEKNNSKRAPARVSAVYERWLVSSCLHAHVWISYIKFLESSGLVSDIEPTAQRALRNCPWSGFLWSAYLRAAERSNRSPEAIKSIFDRAMSAGIQTPDEYQLVMLTRIEQLRIRLESLRAAKAVSDAVAVPAPSISSKQEKLKEEKKSAADSNAVEDEEDEEEDEEEEEEEKPVDPVVEAADEFETEMHRCCDTTQSYFPDYDPTYLLQRTVAMFLKSHLGRTRKANEMFETLLQRRTEDVFLWLHYAEFTRKNSGDWRMIFRRAMSAVNRDPLAVSRIASEWAFMEMQLGDSASLAMAQDEIHPALAASRPQAASSSSQQDAQAYAVAAAEKRAAASAARQQQRKRPAAPAAAPAKKKELGAKRKEVSFEGGAEKEKQAAPPQDSSKKRKLEGGAVENTSAPIPEAEKAPKSAVANADRALFVLNLTFDATADDIRQSFEEGQCKVKAVHLLMKGGKSQGRAIIEFDDVESVAKGLAINYKDLKGRKLMVSRYKASKSPLLTADQTPNQKPIPKKAAAPSSAPAPAAVPRKLPLFAPRSVAKPASSKPRDTAPKTQDDFRKMLSGGK